MVRAAWVKPMTLVQKFEANEAVAATNCWDVMCQSKGYRNGGEATVTSASLGGVPHPELWTKTEYLGRAYKFGDVDTDDRGHTSCHNAGHNQFSFDVAAGTVTFIGEGGETGGGYVTGVSDNGDGVLGIGDEVYWQTEEDVWYVKGLLVWTHWGVISQTPNRS